MRFWHPRPWRRHPFWYGKGLTEKIERDSAEGEHKYSEAVTERRIRERLYPIQHSSPN